MVEEMYQLKPIFQKFELKLATAMYEVKRINATTNDATNGADDEGADGEVQEILTRQNKVLQQLNELKEQLAVIRKTTLTSSSSSVQKASEKKNCKISAGSLLGRNGGLKEEPLHDIVINGHPNFIPYALLALKNAWKDLFIIDIKTFTHSTMTDIGPEARRFEQQIQSVPVTDSSKPKVTVTLIWKNCEHTEMISSPTMYVPIYGEVNIIRYLGRVGPAEYRYEEDALCNETDAILDICYQLLRCTTSKAIARMIASLDKRLAKNQYFGGDHMSVADIGVHSSFKRMTNIKDKDLTANLLAWRKRAQLITKI